MKMNPKEFENWAETRKQGSNGYSLKTSALATIGVFLLHFIVNGYVNIDNIDKYIQFNLIDNVPTVLLTLAILFVFLFIVTKIIFKVQEKRYAETLGSNNTPDNNSTPSA